MLFSLFKKREERISASAIPYPYNRLTGNTYHHLSDGSKFNKGISRSGYSPFFLINAKRQNARTSYEENPSGRAVIRRLNDIIIDRGLIFKSSPLNEIIGISEEEAEKIGDKITTFVDLWMKSKTATSDEKMTGYQSQRFLMLQQLRDGEYFVKFNRDKKNALSSFNIQPIDPNRINSEGVVFTDGNNDIPDNGIYRNAQGKETAYNITTRNSKGFLENTIINAETKSGSKNMIHGMIAEYPDQLRGMGILSHALQELSNMTDLDLSHIMKAIAQSQWVFATESDKDGDFSFDPMENHRGGFGEGAIDYNGFDESPIDEEISTADQLVYKTIDEGQLRIPGSNFIVGAPPGQKVKMLENTAPIASYPEFVQSVFSHLSASADIPLEVVLMKFSQNYSASRATLVLAWRVAGIYQGEIESDCLNEIVKALVEIEIANGNFILPGFSDPRIQAAWLNGKWVGKPMPEIDPYKTMRATELEAGMGLTDLDRKALELNGSDGKVNRRKLKEQYKTLPEPPWKKALNKTGGSL